MTWITDNVLWQEPGEGLASIVASLSGRGIPRQAPSHLAHLLNPYRSESLEVRLTHRRTIASLRSAAALESGVIHVAAVDSDDLDAGSQFDVVVPLAAAASDTGPKIFDVLQCADAPAVTGDYVIFTNMDICVGTSFYRDVRQLIELGAEALIINRRTVHGWDTSAPSSTLASLDLGETHPGMDCFVFPRAWISGFETSDAVIGHGHVMRGLLYNLVARADPLVMLTEVAMTYHYGNDMPWRSAEAKRHFDVNMREAVAVYSALSQDAVADKRLSEFVEALPKYQP